MKDPVQDLSKLNPIVVLNQPSRAAFAKLPLLHLTGDNIGTIKEYGKIMFIDWKEEVPFKSHGIPQDSEESWVGVLHHDSSKACMYRNLKMRGDSSDQCYCGEIFSIVTSVKIKARNHVKLHLDAIVRIRALKQVLRELSSITKNARNFRS